MDIVEDYKTGVIDAAYLLSRVKDEDEESIDDLYEVLPSIVEHDISIGRDVSTLLDVADIVPSKDSYLIVIYYGDKDLVKSTIPRYSRSYFYMSWLQEDMPLLFNKIGEKCDDKQLGMLASLAIEMFPCGTLGVYLTITDEVCWEVATSLLVVSDIDKEMMTVQSYGNMMGGITRGVERLNYLKHGDV